MKRDSLESILGESLRTASMKWHRGPSVVLREGDSYEELKGEGPGYMVGAVLIKRAAGGAELFSECRVHAMRSALRKGCINPQLEMESLHLCVSLIGKANMVKRLDDWKNSKAGAEWIEPKISFPSRELLDFLALKVPDHGVKKFSLDDILYDIKKSGVKITFAPGSSKVSMRVSVGKLLAKYCGCEFCDPKGRVFELSRKKAESGSMYYISMMGAAGTKAEQEVEMIQAPEIIDVTTRQYFIS